MGNILRIFVVGGKGERQAFAFDMGRFVSYNVDTRELSLESGVVSVHKDSEERLIRAYQLLDGADGTGDVIKLRSDLESADNAIDELMLRIGQLEEENESLRAAAGHRKSAWEYIFGKR